MQKATVTRRYEMSEEGSVLESHGTRAPNLRRGTSTSRTRLTSSRSHRAIWPKALGETAVLCLMDTYLLSLDCFIEAMSFALIPAETDPSL